MALFLGNRPVDQGLIAAPDGVVMDEGQVYYVELVFDGTRIMVGPVVAQGGVDHIVTDGLEPWHGRKFALGLAPPDINKAMCFPDRVATHVQGLGRFGIAPYGRNKRASSGSIVFEAMEGALDAFAHDLATLSATPR